MSSQTQPLVSCIMPTYNRREFIPHAIRYFFRQEYENKELIVVDDGTDNIKDLIPDDPAIRYFYLEKKITLGAKLNLACMYARGNIIVHWDDDDWYAPRRIKYQTEALQNPCTDVCGINRLLYYDLRNKKAFQYIYPADQRTWLLGSSLCYKKELWLRHQFADIDVGMDGLFVWATPADRVNVLADITMSVHMIHDRNISPKKTDGTWWHSYPAEEIEKIMHRDLHFYHNGSSAKTAVANVMNAGEIKPAARQYKKLQNVYACLVHESEECIIDLVRNLHYHDPSSIILLYNGSANPHLIPDHFPFDQLGAFIIPDPVPVKHGYLHNFALRCMQFAIEHFAFDTITIVDSDQLATRSGYSAYLSAFLSDRSNVGMLSSKPQRVTRDDKVNHVALQAFKEYELWKPFLKNFPDGENKFVHWTFWPSTVFTSNAVRDLVALVKENRQLQKIIGQSEIWASEEVILPTLVRLLGYEIVANPCSHDFVKYRQSYTVADVSNALSRSDVYWIHPVQRRYADTLRQMVRERSKYYALKTSQGYSANHSSGNLMHALLMHKIKNIEGWLSDREAQLLIETTSKACKLLPAPHCIVEIGSYHGKSTVLLADTAIAHSARAKVYAIDTHDGRLGAADQGLLSFPPSFEMFKKNVENAGLTEVVEIIKSKSYNVKWEMPVALLLIDGLHDYLNVSRDFRHFAPWIITGGYVAFHDHADYFPGVMTFVAELLNSGAYRKISNADSLIILQKL